MDAPTCTFCSRPATLIPTEECRVCPACTKVIAAVATSPSASREIWDAAVPEKRDDEVEAFAARVAQKISPHDSESHFHMAMAYREMGLHGEALREAAIALGSAPEATKATTTLRLLLTPPLLRPDGIAKLKAHVTRMQMN